MVDAASLGAAIDKSTVVTGLKAKTKDEVFTELTRRLHDAGYIDSPEVFMKALYEREGQGATGIGEHVAIPHGRSDTVRRNGIAIAVLGHEIPWESLDDTGAKVVVLFAVGADDEGSKQHLQLLSEFARKLAKADVVHDLLQAENTDQVVAALTR